MNELPASIREVLDEVQGIVSVIPAQPGCFVVDPDDPSENGGTASFHRSRIVGWATYPNGFTLPITTCFMAIMRHVEGDSEFWVMFEDGRVECTSDYRSFETVDDWLKFMGEKRQA